MKKLIAILAIALVIIGAVFADPAVAPSVGTANVKIVTLVGEVEPEFKLTTNSSDSGDLVADPVIVGTMAAPTASDEAVGDAYHVIAKNSLVSSTETETSVIFYVLQTNDCKSYKTYTFTAAAEDLIMVKAYNNAGVLVAYDYEHAEEEDQLHRHFAVDSKAVGTFADADAKFSALKDGSSASAYKITYTGDQVTAGTVASFVCTWTNDVHAVPGQYEANIRLTVTAN